DMAKRTGENLHVTCPCCRAKLVVDPVFGSVLSHEAPPKAGPNIDLEKAHDVLAEQRRQREDKFADSWFQETNKEDILAKKYEEGKGRARGQAHPQFRSGLRVAEIAPRAARGPKKEVFVTPGLGLGRIG